MKDTATLYELVKATADYQKCLGLTIAQCRPLLLDQYYITDEQWLEYDAALLNAAFYYGGNLDVYSDDIYDLPEGSFGR